MECSHRTSVPPPGCLTSIQALVAALCLEYEPLEIAGVTRNLVSFSGSAVVQKGPQER